METIRRAGLLEPKATWIPYWRSEPIARADKPGLWITAYRDHAAHRLTLVVVNPTNADLETTLHTSDTGRTTDAENGTVLTEGGNRIPALSVKRHDFRLLVVE